MEKFTDKECEQLREIVRVELNRSSHLRFGQALWNAAHDMKPEVMDKYRGDSKKDFFYFRSAQDSWVMFLDHYTKQGEQSGKTDQSDSDGSYGFRPDGCKCSPCNNGCNP